MHRVLAANIKYIIQGWPPYLNDTIWYILMFNNDFSFCTNYVLFFIVNFTVIKVGKGKDE